jgi:hypothetical protein
MLRKVRLLIARGCWRKKRFEESEGGGGLKDDLRLLGLVRSRYGNSVYTLATD